MAFNSIGKLLPQRLRQTGVEREVLTSQVIAMANDLLNDIFGPNTTDFQAQVISLKMRKLSIAAVNPAFKQELAMREQDFLFQLNQKVGRTVAEKIKFIL